MSSLVKIGNPDLFHLSAAIGWLELGNWQEANDELEQIQPRLRGHPEVLAVRLAIYQEADNWEMAGDVAEILRNQNPDDAQWWLSLAYATRRRPGSGLPAGRGVSTVSQASYGCVQSRLLCLPAWGFKRGAYAA